MIQRDGAAPTIVRDENDLIARMLLDESGSIPVDRVDWEKFHLRLALRAEQSLARLRHPHLVIIPRGAPAPVRRPVARSWWEPSARWSRVAIGGALAAGTVLIAVIRTSPRIAIDSTSTAAVVSGRDFTDSTRSAFESAVVGRTVAESSRSTFMPSATDLLIPLGEVAQ